MIEALFKYSFIQNAFIASILVSIVCGIIGTIIVEKKLVMMSGGIAHTSFGGIGLGYFLSIEPIIGALIFSIAASLGIAHINRSTKTNSDALVGMFWAIGMAMGILFIGLTPGYPPDMTSYLFGDILTVSKLSIRMMIFVTIIITAIIGTFFNYWKSYLFDDEFSQVLGIPTLFLENLIFVLIALAVVMLIKVVGIILVIALLTIPPAIAKLLTYDLKRIMILSICLGVLFCISGLYISYRFNIPSGATIIIVAGLTFFIIALSQRLKQYILKIKAIH